MLPAYERLGFVDAAAGQFDDGMVMQAELVAGERTAQVVDQVHALQCGFLQAAGEVAETVASRALGGVHGLIRVAHQYFQIGGVVRDKA